MVIGTFSERLHAHDRQLNPMAKIVFIFAAEVVTDIICNLRSPFVLFRNHYNVDASFGNKPGTQLDRWSDRTNFRTNLFAMRTFQVRCRQSSVLPGAQASRNSKHKAARIANPIPPDTEPVKRQRFSDLEMSRQTRSNMISCGRNG
jgi:hypothetical protein